jgi:hypothetical protein
MARKHTVSQAKNRMRRTVAEILDATPSDLAPLWAHFESSCAYCGRRLDRSRREGHVDHAEPGGGNHLGNLVLACGACNGDEKREEPWEAFLDRKVTSPGVRSARSARMRSWLAVNPAAILEASTEVAAKRAELEQLIDDFAQKCNELKALVRGNGSS